MSLHPRPRLSSALLVGLLSVVRPACGSDPKSPGELDAGVEPDAGGGTPTSHAVGGTVTGLREGAQVVLRNGEDSLRVSANGAFVFGQEVAEGSSYAVVIQEQPTGATCTTADASGTVGDADVTRVLVSCAANFHAVGGSVSGLLAGSTLELQNNGGQVLTVTESGSFRFAEEVADLTDYAVTVKAQPEGHDCIVEHGAGTLSGSAVTDVAVHCTARTFSLGGSLFGLTPGKSVVLRNNGEDAITVSANGLFTFARPVAFGAPYAVTVEATYPVTCTVARGEGTMAAQAVTNVAVTCATTRYLVGGTVSGILKGGVLKVQNGAETLLVNTNGPFTFAQPVDDLAGYAVSIVSSPIGHTCEMVGGTGTLSGANVSSVVVTCAAKQFQMSGTVTGLSSGQSVVLKNNGADAVTVTANGAFAFPTGVPYRGTYAVTAEATYPLSCVVPNGTGTQGAADITNVAVACRTWSFAVGGTVTGFVEGMTFELWLNESEVLTVDSNGAFTFTRPVADLGAYAVVVKTQPPGQSCSVRQGTGTVGGSNVTQVAVTCSPDSFAVRGTVAGLDGSRSVVLRNNGGTALTVAANGAFVFPAPVAFGGAYSVSAEIAPPLVCSVAKGFGTMGAGDVTGVTVLCGGTSYPVGGVVAGLAAGATLELQNNGDDVLALSANGPFTFTRSVVDQATYAAMVKTQPVGQRCSVQSGAGAVNGGPVSDIAVSCEDVHALGVHVAGLTGTLGLRSGTDTLTVATDGEHAFAQGLLPGESYSVQVSRQPLGQTCEVLSGTGAMGDADVTVAVSCTPNVMVVHVGGGAAALNSTATEVFLEEYRPTGGAPVRTLSIPAMGPAGANRLTVSGSDDYQGLLARSGDGRLLTFAGYDADAGTANVSGTSSALTSRVVGQVDVAGVFTIGARLSDAYDLDSVRSATTVDGSGYWLAGRGGGIRHVLASASPVASTALSNGVNDCRFVSVFDGRLYFTLGIAPVPNPQGYRQGVHAFASALPTVMETPVQLPSFAVTLTSSGFALLDLDPEVEGVDTAYVSINLNLTASQGGTPDSLRLEKWTFDGAAWSKKDSFVPAFAVAGTTTSRIATHGVSATKTPSGVRVYVTTYLSSSGGAGNMLVTFLDDGRTVTPSVTVLATAPANTAFRGVSASPRP